MSDSTRDNIIDAAAKSGRSVSEEIERRVDISFETRRSDAITEVLLGGNLSSLIAKDLIAAVKLINPGPNDVSFEPQRRALLRAVERILNIRLPNQIPLFPAVERTPDWEEKCSRAEMFGEHVARTVLNDWWASLVDEMAQARATTPAPAGQEPGDFAGGAGLMGTWARDDAQKRDGGP